jgi:hypothetical protein
MEVWQILKKEMNALLASEIDFLRSAGMPRMGSQKHKK